jgi:hypothetical protein
MRLIIDGNRASVPLAVIQLKYRPDGGYDGLGRGTRWRTGEIEKPIEGASGSSTILWIPG